MHWVTLYPYTSPWTSIFYCRSSPVSRSQHSPSLSYPLWWSAHARTKRTAEHVASWSQRSPSLSYPRGFRVLVFALRLSYLQKKTSNIFSWKHITVTLLDMVRLSLNTLSLFYKYDYFCVFFKRENSDWGALRLVWMLLSLSYLNVSFQKNKLWQEIPQTGEHWDQSQYSPVWANPFQKWSITGDTPDWEAFRPVSIPPSLSYLISKIKYNRRYPRLERIETNLDIPQSELSHFKNKL